MDAFLLQVTPTMTELKQRLALAHKESKQHKRSWKQQRTQSGRNNHPIIRETVPSSKGEKCIITEINISISGPIGNAVLSYTLPFQQQFFRTLTGLQTESWCQNLTPETETEVEGSLQDGGQPGQPMEFQTR